MSKYLKFEFIQHKPKTKVFSVLIKKSNRYIGRIAYYGRHKQYAFETQTFTTLSTIHLNEISEFIERLEKERKNAKKVKE